MKVAITGHTSGLGKELFHMFPGAIGFSRSTGYNIATHEGRERILYDAFETDLFINNAYTPSNHFAQIELLWTVWNAWKGTDKTIVCIGSYAGSLVDRDRPGQDGKYAVQKAALDQACRRLVRPGLSPRVINIKPGYLSTPNNNDKLVPKIDVKATAQFIAMLIQQRDLWVPEITLLPYDSTKA
jgi:NAD(P)-dependent dehydrogenase (short-subunit alcohol dehydrogenase family)